VRGIKTAYTFASSTEGKHDLSLLKPIPMKTAFCLFGFFIFVHCSHLIQSNNGITKQGYLIFGIKYGECVYRCAHIYQLQGESLYKEDVVNYISNPFQQNFVFNTTPMSEHHYSNAKILLDSFPNALLNSAVKTFGTPDSHDQGGILIERQLDNRIQRWYIDPDETQLPEYLKPYVTKVKSVLIQMKQ
jgi:hypothetical protein